MSLLDWIVAGIVAGPTVFGVGVAVVAGLTHDPNYHPGSEP